MSASFERPGRSWGRRAEPAVRWALGLGPALVLLLTGTQRRWLDDDGFINLRIVRHLLRGDGPVFNLGERVEAATSPLWLALLAALGRLGVPLELAAVYGGIVLTVLGLVLAQRAAWRLCRPGSAGERPLAAWLERVPLPLGAMLYVAIPPAWDYASSGLETGLALAWLGGSYRVIAGAVQGPVKPPASVFRCLVRIVGSSVLLGLGPLIRPELALTSAVFVVLFAIAWVRPDRAAGGEGGPGKRSAAERGGALALVAVSALMLPLTYQVFRMGYYGASVPNTALAKEAFLPNLSQGLCYYRNFFGFYRTELPVAAAAVFLGVRLRAQWSAGRKLAAATLLAPVLVGLAQVAYIVSIGGDYMHGRMFLPPVFTALLPIAVVSPTAPAWPRAKIVLVVSWAAAFGWALFCGLRLRVGVENVCGIGDERGWYARLAQVDNPVRLSSFRYHFFYKDAEALEQRVRASCPTLSPDGDGDGGGCRGVYLNDAEQALIGPTRPQFPLASDADGRIVAVASAGAIGISGYLLPDSVHVVDIHGLADPIASRLILEKRSRPGHDKRLPVEWTLARFSQPFAGEDAGVAAARRALQCAPLRDLVNAVTGPLSWRGFAANVAHASAFTKLRLPQDPFDAEVQFCHAAVPAARVTSSGGGAPFHWRCPAGLSVSGLRGDFLAREKEKGKEKKPAESDLARVRAVCATEQGMAGDGETPDAEVLGPVYGASAEVSLDESFGVSCPPGSRATGVYGTSDNRVRSLGLLCSHDGAILRTSSAGQSLGTAFALACPAGTVVIGLEGRSGDLVDAVGVLCQRL